MAWGNGDFEVKRGVCVYIYKGVRWGRGVEYREKKNILKKGKTV